MLVIFDWDGTLSDSTHKIVGCMQLASADVGMPSLADEAIKNIIGLGLPEALQALYPSITPMQQDQMRDRYSHHYIVADKVPSAFYEGALEVLQALKLRGHKIAVATGKSRQGLDRVLAKLELASMFDATRCADETASKPNPLMLRELLQEFDVSPDQALMVGDTEYDLAMAQSAGVRSVAVSYGAHHIDRLRPYEPLLCTGDLRDMLALDGVA